MSQIQGQIQGQSYILYAIEVADASEGHEPGGRRLLLRGSDDPFTFLSLDSARLFALACGDPTAEVVGLEVAAVIRA
jgi:hypothetical protein